MVSQALSRVRTTVLTGCVFSACLIAYFSCSYSGFGSSTVATEPNVLVVVVDTLRADRLNATRNGVAVMPYLRSMAGNSTTFEQAVSPCSWTRPAMASLFTALYPEAHHVLFSADPVTPERPTADNLGPQVETLAEFLAKAGYKTAALQTNANLLEEFGFAQGFDVYEYRTGLDAAAVTKRAIEMTAELSSPFFLYAHYMDPHLPYTPPPHYRELFGKPPVLTEADTVGLQNSIAYLYDYVDWKFGFKAERSYEEFTDSAKQEFQTQYDASVRYFDDELAKLVGHFQKNYPNTLIIILSDHGEHFWEHGLMGHGLTLYNEELRVPLVISGPNITPSVIKTPVNTINLMPSIAAYLDLPPNPQWQAHVNLLMDAAPAPLFSRTWGPYPSLGVDLGAVQMEQQKFIQAPTSHELYDLRSDPLERSNLVSASPDALQPLKELLEEHTSATRAWGEKYPAPPKAVLDQQMIDVLTGQGYFGGSTEEVEE